MLLNEMTYEQAVQKADSLLDIGQDRVHLSYGSEDFPWHIAESVKEGCTRRMDIATGFDVSGKDACGITFTWSFDIEDREANGKGYYEIDTGRVIEVMSRMPQQARAELGSLLQNIADTVEQKANEYLKIYSDQMKYAYGLREMVAAAK